MANRPLKRILCLNLTSCLNMIPKKTVTLNQPSIPWPPACPLNKGTHFSKRRPLSKGTDHALHEKGRDQGIDYRNIFKNSFSSSIVTPSSLALSAFDPGSAPTTT